MKMKKILCMVMAMMMALCTVAFADTEDLQAQLEAANARIAELEALINDVYLPIYETQIVAEFGEDGIVWAQDAKAEYDYYANMYAQYGMSINGYEDMIKQGVLDGLVEQGVLAAKATELGLDVLSEEDNAALAAEAEMMYENYISTYKSYFATEGATDEEVRASVIAYLEASGMTLDVLKKDMTANYVSEKLYNYIIADVAVSEEDIKAAYESMVAEQQESFTDEHSYNSARSSGEAIAWNPEGYRAVKHVLIKFDDKQTALYNELDSTLDSLVAEMEALENPAEAAEGEEAEPRTKEEIQADMQAIGVEIEGLYSQLMPEAQKVIDAFNAGTDIETLIAQYNDDPGMNSEPAKTIGYAVSNQEGYWDPAFIKGAMAIAEVGQISEPVYGSYGIHIIYYMMDVVPGVVAFEEIASAVENNALEAKISDTYNAQVNAWVEEAAPVYHLDRF